MLKQFDFALGETKKDLEFVAEAKKKHQNHLRQLEEVIKTKKDLEKKFTQQQLQAHTEHVTSSQDKESAKMLAAQFVKFIQKLKFPFETTNNHIHDNIIDILQLPSVKAYEKQINQSLKFRLLKYQNQLDKKDQEAITKIEASNEIPLTFSHGSSGLRNEKQLGQFSRIVLRDAILSKSFNELHAEYESVLLRTLFTKLYQTTRKTTILGQQYHEKEIELILKHIEALFKINNSMLRQVLKKPRIGYSYAIKQLYRYLVANNVVGILKMYKDKLSKEKMYELVQTMLKLEANIKMKTSSEDEQPREGDRPPHSPRSEQYIGDKESIINLIYQKHYPIFRQLLQYEESSFKNNILENPNVANIDTLEQLQDANQAFKTLLQMYYSKYQHSTSKYKQEVNKVYTELVCKMIKYMKYNIINIVNMMKSETKRELRYKILEYSKMVESEYDKNQIINEIKKNNKEIQDDLNKFKSETNSVFLALVNEEYSALKKTIFAEDKDLQKLYKEKEHTLIQKTMFLRRMRILFFKFIKDQEFTKTKLKRFMKMFQPFMEKEFEGKYKEIVKVIESGNFAKEHKQLMFLDKEERQALTQLKVSF